MGIQLENEGPWDLKQLSEWGNSSLYIFDGEIVDRDAPGNIMYGYMGHTYGIPDTMLYGGGAYAQVIAGTSKAEWMFVPLSPRTWGDDPKDRANIERGITYYEKIHCKKSKEVTCIE